MNKVRLTAIILAAGSGSRMMSSVTKQRMIIDGESVLRRSVRAFNECPLIDEIVVAVREDEIEYATAELKDCFQKLTNIVVGGKSRAESAKIAFSAIDSAADFVAIHDGARCLITSEMISKVVETALECGAATAGTWVSDTIKRVGKDGVIVETVRRDEIFAASTPQIFSAELYKKALREAKDYEAVTDDNTLVERLGIKIAAVDIGKENIKITTPSDIDYAEYLILKRKGEKMGQHRVGHGYDVHRFADGRRLILGGVDIPYEKGLLGHSDADVLTHAIMDSLLGAAALGDIGRHFPDSDEEFKGVSSILLLKKVAFLLDKKGYEVVNVDATLVMQKPKILPYVEEMTENIASALGIEKDRVNIKATTEEKLGFTGNGDGAAAHSVAMIIKK